jgi:phage shock protein A
MSHILTANLHDFVDHFEDPETMLRQTIREMDDAIDAATMAAARSIAAEKLLDKQIETGRAQVARWQRVAEAAVADDDDDRARRALARRREQERCVDLFAEQRAASQEASARWRRRIDAMKQKRADAGRLLIELAARESLAHADALRPARAFDSASSPVFYRFVYQRERLERALAEAEAVLEITDDESADGDCLQTDAIEAELLELKQRAAGR